MKIKLLFILIINLLCISCAKKLSPITRNYISTTDTNIYIKSNKIDTLQIQYLGCGGMLISKNKNKILIDPFFSNPLFLSIWVKPNKKRINKAFEKINYQGITTCLISHAHYDHLLDIPYISQQYFNNKLHIYGSKTVINILISKGLETNYLHNIEADTCSLTSEGTWTYINNNQIRFLPVKYEHAPHLKIVNKTFKFFNGNYNTIPSNSNKSTHYKEGQTLGYLIDFLKDSIIEKRVYTLSGGAANPEFGNLSQHASLNNHTIDILTICVASHNYVNNYPKSIITDVKPEFILATHWEDFFKKYPFSKKHLKSVPFTNLNSFFNKMNSDLKFQNQWNIINPLIKTNYIYYK